MSIVKVIEVIAESEKSWEDAAQNAVNEASQTVREILQVDLNHLQAIVQKNRIVKYRVNCKVSFLVQH